MKKPTIKEKQSDVSLAAHLLMTHGKINTIMVIISNDTDFYGVIQLVLTESPHSAHKIAG